MAWLSEIAAAVRVEMSPRLLRWFASFAPKGDKRKLAFRKLGDGSYEHDEIELALEDRHDEPSPFSTCWSPSPAR